MDEFTGLEGLFADAILGGNWPLVVAVLIAFAVYIIRKIPIVQQKVKAKYLPLLSISISVLSTVSASVIDAVARNHTWWVAAISDIPSGFVLGLIASGLWDTRKLWAEPKKE